MNDPSYYSILTAKVRYDNRINSNCKLLYSEITCLCNAEGYCWAPDEYFAELYDVSSRTIARWVKKLCDCGFIERVLLYGSKNDIIGRRIYLAETVPGGVDKNVNRGIDKNVNRCRQNCQHTNNININNIIEDEEEVVDKDVLNNNINKSAGACVREDITNKEQEEKLVLFDELKESLDCIREESAPGFDCVKDSEALIPCLTFFASELVYRDECNINGRKIKCLDLLSCLNTALKKCREKEVLDVFREVSELAKNGKVKNQFAFLASNLFNRLKLTVI